MTIIADSSLLISIVKIGRLGTLRKLYRRVLIPPSVHYEVVIQGNRLRKPGVREIENAIESGWIQVISLNKSQRDNAEKLRTSSVIGRGEAEAAALAKSRRLALIADDRHARELAAAMQLQFIGTGAVLLEARWKGILSRKEFIESLRELGKVMWLSPDVVAELIRLAEGEEK